MCSCTSFIKTENVFTMFSQPLRVYKNKHIHCVYRRLEVKLKKTIITFWGRFSYIFACLATQSYFFFLDLVETMAMILAWALLFSISGYQVCSGRVNVPGTCPVSGYGCLQCLSRGSSNLERCYQQYIFLRETTVSDNIFHEGSYIKPL